MSCAAMFGQISVEITSLHLVPWNLRMKSVLEFSVSAAALLLLTSGMVPIQGSILMALIPPSKYTKIPFADFDITNKEHRDKMSYGRVELLFRCCFRPDLADEGGEILQCDLDLISCLYNFRCPLASNSMQRMAGARLLYQAKTP